MKVEIGKRHQIFFTEFAARFCTWSILSQLLVHLTAAHWKAEAQQLYIVGASLSLLYMSAIIGGMVKDWFFSSEQVVLIGVGLIALGCLSLISNPTSFYPGLATILLGAGMVTPNTPLLVASLPLSDKDRDRNFTILYGVTNAGIILGSVLGGIVNNYLPWKGILYLNEVIVLFLIVYIVGTKSLISTLKTVNPKKLFYFIFLFINVEILATLFLKLQTVSEMVLISVMIYYLGLLSYLVVKHPELRKTFLLSLFLVTLAVIFFSAEFQVASTLIAYSQNFVNLKVFDLHIPPGSLLALESIFVVITAFLIPKLKLLSNIENLQTKVLIGLVSGALAFALLYSSTLMATYYSISLTWILFASLLLGVGDVYLMPSIMSHVARTAPPNFKGRFIAGLYFSLSLSGYLSGLIASILSKSFTSSAVNLNFYSDSFIVMIILLSAAAIILFFVKSISVKAYSTG